MFTHVNKEVTTYSLVLEGDTAQHEIIDFSRVSLKIYEAFHPMTEDATRRFLLRQWREIYSRDQRYEDIRKVTLIKNIYSDKSSPPARSFLTSVDTKEGR